MIMRDENTSTDALAIVEKYEAFVSYLYPILQNAPRRHAVIRDVVLAALFVPIGGLYHAAKSQQVSRLYAVDAEFATLRSHLRFLGNVNIRIVGPKQHEVALAVLAHLENGENSEATAYFVGSCEVNDHGIGLEFADSRRLADFFKKIAL